MQNQKNSDRKASHEKPNSGNKSYLRYSGLGLQLFITIGIFGWAGYKMDEHWNNDKPLFIIIMIFVGIAVGFYQFYRAVNK